MKLTKFKSSLLVITTILINLPAFAKSVEYPELYSKDALTRVEKAVVAAAKLGQKPIVIFDLDDTLLDSNSRKALIFRMMAQEPVFEKQWPEAAVILSSIGASNMRWSPAAVLNDYGIKDTDAQAFAEKYVMARFLANPFCALDEEVTGARQFVLKIQSLGGQVVYLTGRDIPLLGKCTVTSLERRGFPLKGRTKLMMKPEKSIPDLEFKKTAFAEIAQAGTVVAFFENEPANLNAMAEKFSSAIGVFVDTLHSPAPARPYTDAAWIKNYIQSK